MSLDIDRRIVEMRFENGQFEESITKSSTLLEKFKKQLKFEGAEKGIEEIQRAGKRFSLQPMAQSIENIERRFSLMGIAGMRVIERMTDRVIDAGERMAKSLSVDQLSRGFSKYEDKTKSVQTIVNATGKSVDEVNKSLNKLAWFTDETSYNFVDMVSNIGKFTSMNIDLEDAVTAMEGIAAEAAVSGQGINEASRAMYNFAQAIGAGSVKLMDWRSIENANMATSEFKQTIIDTAKELGILNKEGKTKKGTLVDFKNFSQTLNEGWFTSDVLIRSLKKYGEYADEIYQIASREGITAAEAMAKYSNEAMKLGEKAFKAAQEAKTFNDAIEATKDAVSTGWMNTFELIFGNYEEAKVLWTDLANALWEIFASGAEERNEVLRAWHDTPLAGREQALKAIYSILSSIWNIAKTMKNAILDIFPPMALDNLQKMTIALTGVSTKLRTISKITSKFVGYDIEEIEGGFEDLEGALNETLKRGSTGEGVKKLQERLIELGYDVGKAGVDGILGPDTERALKEFEEKTGLTIDGLYDEATHKSLVDALIGKRGGKQKLIERYEEILSPFLDKIRRITSGVAAVAHIAWQGIGFVWNVLLKVFDTLSPIANLFFELSAALGDFFVNLDKTISESSTFADWLEKIDSFLKPIKGSLENVSNLILAFLGIGDVKVDASFSSLDHWLDAAKKKFKGVFTSLSKWVQSLFGINENGKSAGGSGGLLSFFDPMMIFGGILAILTTVASVKVISALTAVTSTIRSVKKLVKTVNTLLSGGLGDIRAAKAASWGDSILKIAIGIVAVAGAVFLLSRLNWSELSVGLTGLTLIMGLLIGTVFAFKYATKGLGDIEKVVTTILVLSGAIVALSAATYILSGINGYALVKAVAAVGTLMGILVLAVYAMKMVTKSPEDLVKSVGTFAAIAGAVAMLVGSVERLARIDAVLLVKGLTGLMAIFLATALFMKSIGSVHISASSIVSIFVISLAINLLTLALSGMALTARVLGTGALVKAFIAMAGIMAAMAIFMKAISKIRISPSAIISLATIAITIDALVLGFVVLAATMKFMSFSDLAKALIGLVGIVVGIKMVMNAMETIKPKFRNIFALLIVAIAIDALVAGFAVLAITMKYVDFASLVKSMVALASIVATTALVMKAMEKIKPKFRNIVSILIVAVALDALVIGFSVLAITMKHAGLSGLAGGLTALVGIVATVALVMKVMNKSKPKIRNLIPFLVASAALSLLMVSFGVMARTLSGVNVITLVGSVLSVIGLVKAMEYLMRAMQNVKISLKTIFGMIPMVIAMVVLMTGFAFFARSMAAVNFTAIAKAILALGGIAISMAIFMKAVSAISGIKTGVASLLMSVGLVGAMIAFAVSLEKVKDIGVDKILGFAGGLALLMVGMSAALIVLGSIPISILLKGLLGMAIIIGAIAAVIAAVAALNKIPGFKRFMNSGAEALGELIGSFIGGMKVGEIKALSRGIRSLNGIDSIDEKKLESILNTAKLISDFSNNLPKKSAGEKASDLFFGSDMMNLSRDMVVFGLGMRSFNASLGDIDIDSKFITKVKNAISVAKEMDNLGSSLTTKSNTSKLWSWITGGAMSELGLHSKEMASFAAGFTAFADAMRPIAIDEELEVKSRYIGGIGSVFADIATNLKDDSLVEKAISFFLPFMTDMGNFSGIEMPAFVDGFDNFVQAMSDVKLETDSMTQSELDEKVAFMAKIAGAFITLDQELPPEVKSWSWDKSAAFFNKPEWSSFGTFTKNMQAFTSGFISFQNAMKNVADAKKADNGGQSLEDISGKVERMGKITEALIALEEKLPESAKTFSWDKASVLFGNMDISSFGTFANNMSAYAVGFNAFQLAMRHVGRAKETDKDEQSLEDISGKVERMGKITEAVIALEEKLPESARTFSWDKASVLFGNMDLTSFGTFTSNMRAFASGFLDFQDAMWYVAEANKSDKAREEETGEQSLEDISGKVLKMSEITSALSELETKLPPDTKQFSWDKISAFFGGSWTKVSSFGTFAANMSAFASGFGDFAKAMNNVKVDGDNTLSLEEMKSRAAIMGDITYALIELDEDLPPQKTAFGKIAEWFSGESDGTFEGFTSNMTDFANGVGSFVETMRAIGVVQDDLDATDLAISAAEKCVAFFHGLSLQEKQVEADKNFINRFFNGDTNINTVFSKIGEFGDTIKTSSFDLGGLSDGSFASDMLVAINVADQMTKFLLRLQKLQEEGTTISYSQNFDTITGAMGTFGNAVNTLNTYVAEANLEKFDTVANGMWALVRSLIGLASFGSDIDSQQLGNNIAGVFEGMTTMLSNGELWNSMDVTSVTTLFDNMILELTSVQQTYRNQFKTVGEFVAGGLAEGISAGKSLAVQAAIDLMAAAVTAAREEGKVESPSKVFAEIGRYLDEGLAKGIGDNAIVAESAMAILTRDLADEVDSDLTIRPIVDMSNVDESARQIGRLMNQNGSVNLDASFSRSQANAIGRNANRNQNGSSVSNTYNSSDDSINFPSATFVIRSDQDIRDLASELASLTNRQNRSMGAAHA